MDVADPRRGAGNLFDQFKVAAEVMESGRGGRRAGRGLVCSGRPTWRCSRRSRAANEEVGDKRSLRRLDLHPLTQAARAKPGCPGVQMEVRVAGTPIPGLLR